MSIQPKGRPGFPTLSLEYPMSLGVFEEYKDAQKAVDTLSDAGFPVENCLIVGTDLKQLERVTARLTWGRVALGGLITGLWFGLFVGLIFALFGQQNALSLLLSTALYGALFGLVWVLVGYAFTRGARDFQSVSQVVATRYEVFAEHKVAQQAREILAEKGIAVGTYAHPAHLEASGQPSVTPSVVPPPPAAAPPSTEAPQEPGTTPGQETPVEDRSEGRTGS
jgi:hypothetical protein